MARTIALLVVIMAAMPTFVNAESEHLSAPKIETFVGRVLSAGFDNPILPNIARALGFSDEVPAKAEGTDPDEAVDARDRNALVVTEVSDNGVRPVCLLLKAELSKGHESNCHWVKLGVDGKPELVMVVNGKLDASGKPIRGSGKATTLDLKSKEAKAIVKYELDYWLHNKYRTKLGKLRLTNPNATMADVQADEAKAMNELKGEESKSGGDAGSGKSAAQAPAQ